MTPFDLAASEGHVSVITYLMEEDVLPNPVDKEKVMYYASCACNRVVRYFACAQIMQMSFACSVST